jgi:ABC-type amino acid transport system permease subunit
MYIYIIEGVIIVFSVQYRWSMRIVLRIFFPSGHKYIYKEKCYFCFFFSLLEGIHRQKMIGIIFWFIFNLTPNVNKTSITKPYASYLKEKHQREWQKKMRKIKEGNQYGRTIMISIVVSSAQVSSENTLTNGQCHSYI